MTTDQETWLASLFAAIDAMDVERFVAHLAPDVEFQFGNLPAVNGTAPVAAMVAGFFAGLRGLRHTRLESWAAADTLICRGTVDYVRQDGHEVSLPYANIMRLDAGLAREYRIYADVSPLYA